MLVSLAQNETISASGSSTWTYAPQSFQEVLIRMEDADWDDATLTVQVGSTTICNGAKMFGLAGITALSSGFSVNDATTNGFIALSFGSHVCTSNDNVYIYLHNITSGLLYSAAFAPLHVLLYRNRFCCKDENACQIDK